MIVVDARMTKEIFAVAKGCTLNWKKKNCMSLLAQSKRQLSLNIVAAVASLFILVPGAFADDDDKPAPRLQGGVVEVSVTLNDLRDARLSISRVRKAVANLYDEVTRQQVTMSYNPNIVGTTVITVPTPSFSGGYLPPRRKWVKASMEEMGPIINLFKEDVDLAIEDNRRTNVPEDVRAKLEPLRNEAFAAIKNSFELFKELEGLTSGSNIDNGSVATTVRSLDSNMKQLDKSLKKGISILQKEAKNSKKA